MRAGDCSPARRISSWAWPSSNNCRRSRGVEIAFAGRSNVGKSSLINALTGVNGLARASNTPGRTRELNFFDVDEPLTLVDMPGYGYAKASKHDVKQWQAVLRATCAAVPV